VELNETVSAKCELKVLCHAETFGVTVLESHLGLNHSLVSTRPCIRMRRGLDVARRKLLRRARERDSQPNCLEVHNLSLAKSRARS
jgi:hypothetical protein